MSLGLTGSIYNLKKQFIEKKFPGDREPTARVSAEREGVSPIPSGRREGGSTEETLAHVICQRKSGMRKKKPRGEKGN